MNKLYFVQDKLSKPSNNEIESLLLQFRYQKKRKRAKSTETAELYED